MRASAARFGSAKKLQRMRASISLLLAVGLLGVLPAAAQSSGGDYGFAWLLSAPSAQTAGLGGWQLRTDGRDPALAGWNPASLNAETHAVAHLSQDFLPTGAGRSIAAAAYRAGGFDLGASVGYVGFGEFTSRDPTGAPSGEFNAREYALGLAAAKHLDERLHVGLQLQFVGGTIERFSSAGAVVSAGALYTPDSAGLTVIGLQLQNAGFVWDDYADASEVAQPMPLALSLGVSRRLRYLPLRVGVLYRRLDRWNLLYDDPDRREENLLIGVDAEGPSEASQTLDNFARHFSFNAEFYIGGNELLQLRVGYDHQRQREARVGDFRSLAGFSYGLGLNLRRLRLDFGRTVQHLAGGSTHVGLLVDFAPPARSKA